MLGETRVGCGVEHSISFDVVGVVLVLKVLLLLLLLLPNIIVVDVGVVVS